MNAKGLILTYSIHYGFPILCALAAIPFLLLARRDRPPPRRGLLLGAGVLFLLLSRVALPAALFLAFHLPPPWDLQYFHSQGVAVLDGQIPSLDFRNFYGPLFPYVNALGPAAFPGHGAWTSLLGFVLADVAATAIAVRLAATWYPGPRAAWLAAAIVLTPLPWHLQSLYGQDESVAVLFLLAGIAAAMRRRPLLLGALLAAGVAFTKVTFAPYGFAILAPYFARHPREAVLAGAVFVSGTGAPYALLIAAGARPFEVAELMGRYLMDWFYNASSPLLLHGGAVGKWIASGIYAGGAAAAALWLAWRDRRRAPEVAVLASVLAVHSVAMLTKPFVCTYYMTIGAAAFLLLAFHPRAGIPVVPATAAFAAASAIVCVNPRMDSFQSRAIAVPAFLLFHALLLAHLLRRPADGGEAAEA
jgi:hypothetical protein